MKKLFWLLPFTACTKDPDKLLGDSNVYIEPLEIGEFNSTEETDTDIIQQSTLGVEAEVQDGTIGVSHLVEAPCSHTWNTITVDSSEAFLIQVDYGLDAIASEQCFFFLEYEIGIAGSGLPPGLYKIKALEDSTEIDLTEALSN